MGECARGGLCGRGGQAYDMDGDMWWGWGHVAGCGGMWQGVGACGRVWGHVAGCRGMWQGVGGMWQG